jgi:oligopeptidase B
VTALPTPLAAEKPCTSTWHGVTMIDPFHWLRASNWQEVMRNPAVLDDEIRAYLEAENAYADSALADTAGLQTVLFEEMKARLKPDDRTVPAPDGPFEYFSSFATGGQYPRFARRPRGGGEETILIDGNAEAAGKTYWDLGDTAHSPDHRLVAFSTDDKGSELYTIRIRDTATGENLPDLITDTRGDIVWGNDSRTLYYIRVDANHRPRSVWRHTLGSPVADDACVYEEADEGFYLALGKTLSHAFVMINAHDHQTSEFYLLDANDPKAAPRMVSARSTGHEYDVEHHGQSLIITTNSNGAEDFRIVEAPLSDPRQVNWREIVPHRAGRLIIDTNVTRDHLVRLEREDGLPRIVVRRFADGEEHNIAFEEEAYSLGMMSGYEFDTVNLRFTYSSMTTPAETYDYDMEARSRVLRKRQEVPSGHNPDDYITRRLFAIAHDGERVPVSLLYRKDTPLDGTAPVYLYGYGAYGISMPASFATGRFSLVDRGFIFALAHVRGGKDKGYRWYKDGKMRSKVNTFTDFIAAGEMLISEGLTQRGHIIANGGSAGGMLMGAVANMAPELFLGIIADVPFVDVLNTMLDKDLPLTPPEWPEWGNPIESPDDFAYIRAYSPYDNVTAKAYPHILATGGLTDPRVTYWEPAKWVAKLRRHNTSGNLLLLKINMGAGHGGASGRFERLKETARDFAFALKISGLAGLPHSSNQT